jgi:acetyl esterase/lipase
MIVFQRSDGHPVCCLAMTSPLIRLWGAALVAQLIASAQLSPRIERDIPYAEPRNERQLLEVYAPASGAQLPVVVWVHGGGWMRGSKEEVEHQPKAFVEKGFVFVPVNYRFVPHVTMGVIIRDVAQATAWVYGNIARWGGDPLRILLMGHSAGAQLAVEIRRQPPAAEQSCRGQVMVMPRRFMPSKAAVL